MSSSPGIVCVVIVTAELEIVDILYLKIERVKYFSRFFPHFLLKRQKFYIHVKKLLSSVYNGNRQQFILYQFQCFPDYG
ncbi:hypothetical protein SDC9_84949 [bioreactor metagenome]|uniref:Uncharacterized protein n=1 Tax=bioreactor metagenome TaxID=1076179 RepID=A0A644ZBP9_9ZZZZ